MAMNNDDVVSVLNGLIETCKDGVDGFRTAAQGVKSSTAKTLFTTRIQSIERAESELETQVRRLGGDPEKSGSVAGALHRGWIDIKSTVTGKDDDAIIAECVRGEDVAVKNYEEALDKDLPADVRSMVERQYHGAMENRDAVRALQRSSSSSTSASTSARAADSDASSRG